LTVASLCLIALLATAAQASGRTTGGISVNAVARDRTTSDLPDDVGGSQVHFLYVVPSGGVDGQLDTNGVISASVASWQAWLRGQTGGRGLRLDTYHGELTSRFFVSLVRMKADAHSTSFGPLVSMTQPRSTPPTTTVALVGPRAVLRLSSTRS
jgi:hypothetical protein